MLSGLRGHVTAGVIVGPAVPRPPPRPSSCARSARKDAPNCPPELRVFAGRLVMPVLAGRIIKPIAASYTTDAFLTELRSAGVSLLLPSGSGLGFGDACFQAAPFV